MLLVVLAALAACSDDETSGQASESAVDTTSVCEQPLPAPGEYEGLSKTDEISHPYSVFVSESLDPTVPAPVYLYLAGGNGDLDLFLSFWRPYYATADAPGLLVTVGTEDRATAESLLGVIDQVSDEHCVDPNRIHAMGISSAAMYPVTLACSAPDRVSSFTSGIGATDPRLFCNPEPSPPVPLLSFTGDWDRTGDTQLVTEWAEFNGCDPQPTTEDLGSGVSHINYEGCDAPVEFFDTEGMGHGWPLHDCLYDVRDPVETQLCMEYEEVDYLEAAFRFFDENPMQ